MLQVETIAGRMIVIKGIGQMFYQDGFPISMAVSELKNKGIDVSILHVADECMKNGWSADTTFTKLKDDFTYGIHGDTVDEAILYLFCHADYSLQREMMFRYLFPDENAAVQWLNEKIKK